MMKRIYAEHDLQEVGPHVEAHASHLGREQAALVTCILRDAYNETIAEYLTVLSQQPEVACHDRNGVQWALKDVCAEQPFVQALLSSSLNVFTELCMQQPCLR